MQLLHTDEAVCTWQALRLTVTLPIRNTTQLHLHMQGSLPCRAQSSYS